MYRRAYRSKYKEKMYFKDIIIETMYFEDISKETMYFKINSSHTVHPRARPPVDVQEDLRRRPVRGVGGHQRPHPRRWGAVALQRLQPLR